MYMYSSTGTIIPRNSTALPLESAVNPHRFTVGGSGITCYGAACHLKYCTIAHVYTAAFFGRVVLYGSACHLKKCPIAYAYTAAILSIIVFYGSARHNKRSFCVYGCAVPINKPRNYYIVCNLGCTVWIHKEAILALAMTETTSFKCYLSPEGELTAASYLEMIMAITYFFAGKRSSCAVVFDGYVFFGWDYEALNGVEIACYRDDTGFIDTCTVNGILQFGFI